MSRAVLSYFGYDGTACRAAVLAAWLDVPHAAGLYGAAGAVDMPPAD